MNYEKKIGTCTECREENVELTVLNSNEHLCSECLEKNYFFCMECEEYVTNDDDSHTFCDGDMICSSCREEACFYCEECGEYVFKLVARSFVLDDGRTVCDMCYDELTGANLDDDE